MTNAVARFFSRREHLSIFLWPLRCRSAKEIACLFVSLQQGFDSEAKLTVSLASLVQIATALLRRKAESLREDGNIRVRSTIHFTNMGFLPSPGLNSPWRQMISVQRSGLFHGCLISAFSCPP